MKQTTNLVNINTGLHKACTLATIDSTTGEIKLWNQLSTHIVRDDMSTEIYNEVDGNLVVNIEESVNETYAFLDKCYRVFGSAVLDIIAESCFAGEAYSASAKFSNDDFPSLEEFGKGLYWTLTNYQGDFLADDSLTDWINWLERYVY